MKEELQRIEIAKSLGRVQRMDGFWYPEGDNVGRQGIPDYLNDLNAMHEVEKSLNHDNIDGADLGKYLDLLVEIACGDAAHPSGYTTAVMATSRQRAEAYLKTIDKWKA